MSFKTKTIMSNTYTTKKALKIATALYMITDIMSDKEPLKWHLRNCAVSLIEADDKNIYSVIEKTIDILQIAKMARAVTLMNANVLEEELRRLLSQIEEDISKKKDDSVALSQSFFEVNITQAIEPPKVEVKVEEKIEIQKTSVFEPKAEETPVHKIIEEVNISPIKKEIESPVMTQSLEERKVERPATTLIPQGIRSAFSPRISLIDEDITERKVKTDDVKQGRRDIILSVIREKENCSIKDISVKLPEVSEKTIQRELLSMTEEGIIIREGDRRWATYRVSNRTNSF